MKINPGGIKAYHTYNSQVNNKKENSTAPKGTDNLIKDRLDISQKARELAKYRQELDQIPDVRSELVKKIKTRLQNGDYRPSAEKIAAGIIKEKLLDEKV